MRAMAILLLHRAYGISNDRPSSPTQQIVRSAPALRYRRVSCLGGVYTKCVSINYMALTAGINHHEEVVHARHDDPFPSSNVQRLDRPSVVTDATNREVGAGTQVPARLSAV